MRDEIYRMLKMMEVIRLRGGNVKRAGYYKSAAESVMKFDEISLDNYRDINAGDKILLNIKNYLEGNGIEDIDRLTDEEYDKIYVMSEFIELKGIGIKKAEKLYDEGKRNIEDLKEGGMTKMSKTALKYENDLKHRVKRETIDKWLKVFGDIIAEINDGDNSLFITPAGSYCRGEQTSGDLDVILCSYVQNEPTKYFKEIVEKLYDSQIIIETLTQGSNKFEGIGSIESEPKFQVDIEIVNSLDKYWYELLYFTGPASFVTKLRDTANKLGYHLTNYEMLDQNKQKIQVHNEEEIFQLLNIPYLPPNLRK